MSSNNNRIKLNTTYGTTNDDSLKYISQLNISDLHITRNKGSSSVDKSLMMMSYLPDMTMNTDYNHSLGRDPLRKNDSRSERISPVQKDINITIIIINTFLTTRLHIIISSISIIILTFYIFF